MSTPVRVIAGFRLSRPVHLAPRGRCTAAEVYHYGAPEPPERKGWAASCNCRQEYRAGNHGILLPYRALEVKGEEGIDLSENAIEHDQ